MRLNEGPRDVGHGVYQKLCAQELEISNNLLDVMTNLNVGFLK
jgi:hypothetical protein